MRFYTQQHKFYCGIDLHTQRMFVCILDAGGNVRIHQNIHTDPEAFLRIITPFREDIVVAAFIYPISLSCQMLYPCRQVRYFRP